MCQFLCLSDRSSLWSLMLQSLFLHLGGFQLCLWTRWRILVVGHLDLKLSEKQAEEIIDASQSETSCVTEECWPISDFKCKTVWFSVFTGSKQLLCLLWRGGDSVENSAPGQNLLNHWHWWIQTRRGLQLPWSHTASWHQPFCICFDWGTPRGRTGSYRLSLTCQIINLPQRCLESVKHQETNLIQTEKLPRNQRRDSNSGRTHRK